MSNVIAGSIPSAGPARLVCTSDTTEMIRARILGPMRARIMAGALAGAAAFGAIACEPVPGAPATLEGGVYCLAGDVSADGAPAFVLHGDTTLDCQGHRISDASLSTANAVVGTGDNVVVRNCVFEGFATPLWLYDASNYRVIANTFLGPMDQALYVDGTQGLISRNVFRYPAERQAGYPESWYSESTTIQTSGLVDIVDNTISAARGAGDGRGWTLRIGIFSYGNPGGLLARNVVRGLIPGSGYDRRAIVAYGRIVAFRNVMIGDPLDEDMAPYDEGLRCDESVVSLGNIARGFRVERAACFDHGHVGLKPGRRR